MADRTTDDLAVLPDCWKPLDSPGPCKGYASLRLSWDELVQALAKAAIGAQALEHERNVLRTVVEVLKTSIAAANMRLAEHGLPIQEVSAEMERQLAKFK